MKRADCFTNEQSMATRGVMTPILSNMFFLPITATAEHISGGPLSLHQTLIITALCGGTPITAGCTRDWTLGQLTCPSMPSQYTELGFDANSRLHQGSGSKRHLCNYLFLSHAKGEEITLAGSDASFLWLGAALKMPGS